MLEIGKYYQQRNGVVVGPLETYTGRMSKNGFVFCCSAEGIAQRAWREDGSWSSYKNDKANFDIVSGVEFIPLSQQPKEEIVSKEFKFEAGKYYKDRDGIVLGPMISRSSARYPFEDENGDTYTKNGLYVEGEEHGYDLIEEVQNPYEIKPEEIVKLTDEVLCTDGEKTDADNRPTIEEVLSAIQRGDEVIGIDDYENFPIRANHAIQRLLDAKSFEIKVKQPVVKYRILYRMTQSDDPGISSDYYSNEQEFLERHAPMTFTDVFVIEFSRKEF